MARQTTKYTADAIKNWAGIVIVYVLLIFILPANSQTMQAYGLSSLEYRSLFFVIALPSLLAWLAAFWGYATLREYAQSVKSSKEGIQFDRLAKGCHWLAWSLPLPAALSLILNAMGDTWHGWHSPAIIIINYLTVFLPLIAFVLISSATQNLVRSTKKGFMVGGSHIVTLIFILAGVLYCYLSFRRFDLTSISSTHNPYLLPVWLVVLSITVPYLYTWFIGLLGAYEITLFSKLTTGFLYKRALSLLAGGLVLIIMSAIALQYVNGLLPSVGHLTLNYKLALVLFFRLLGATGFLLMALGAKRLKKIEEV